MEFIPTGSKKLLRVAGMEVTVWRSESSGYVFCYNPRPMQVRPIAYDAPEYREELALRNRMLRIPLGLDLFDEDLEVERGQWHFGLFDGDVLVGCVVAAPSGDKGVQIRQMAIDSDSQRTGRGRTLLESVEQMLIDRGVRHVVLHARDEAVGFYQKLGYTVVGEGFVEVGILHHHMKKQLCRP